MTVQFQKSTDGSGHFCDDLLTRLTLKTGAVPNFDNGQ